MPALRRVYSGQLAVSVRVRRWPSVSVGGRGRVRNPWPCGRSVAGNPGRNPWPAGAGGRSSQPGRPASRCQPVPAGAGADSDADIRHPVTAGEFRSRFLDFDFNRENLGRKHFGFWKMENPISENRFYPENSEAKTNHLTGRATLWPNTQRHMPRILVACEFSGTVRDAFKARGWDAWSCDLLPTETPGQHIQGDALTILADGWDMMIAHPPCTYLCASGLHWNKRRPTRATQTEEALGFVRRLLDAPIARIAVENPIGCIATRIRPADQIIQPWQFGHGETKATCLWLKELPKLQPTNVVSGRENRIWRMPPGKDRWKQRSLTYQGIAQAMADQWTLTA